MKIVDVVTLQACGTYAASRHWKKTRKQIHDAVRKCEWPIGSGSFTIHPQSGKKRGEGNGVLPIRNEFVKFLKANGWAIEGPSKNALDQALGDFDAVLPGPEKPIVVEWETGNISMLLKNSLPYAWHFGNRWMVNFRVARHPTKWDTKRLSSQICG